MGRANNSVTILVTTDGIWNANRSYWILTTHNYKSGLCSHCSIHFTKHYRTH
jgi:hypothetical protein